VVVLGSKAVLGVGASKRGIALGLGNWQRIIMGKVWDVWEVWEVWEVCRCVGV
jgi:hypothetical protein